MLVLLSLLCIAQADVGNLQARLEKQGRLVVALGSLIESQERELTDTNKKNSLLLDEKTRLETQILDAEKQAQDIEYSLKKWYHSPWTMTILGVALGAVGMSVVFIGVHK